MPRYKSSRSGWVMVSDFRRRQSNSKAVATMAARMASTPCKVFLEVGTQKSKGNPSPKKMGKIPIPPKKNKKNNINFPSWNFKYFWWFWRLNFPVVFLFADVSKRRRWMGLWKSLGFCISKTACWPMNKDQFSAILNGYNKKTFSRVMDNCWDGFWKGACLVDVHFEW